MNTLQRKIAELIESTELRSRSDSDYFKNDGGVSIGKIAHNLGETEATIRTTAATMNSWLTTTTRSNSKEGYKAKRAMHTELARLRGIEGTARQTADAAAWQTRENNRVSADITRAKNLGII